MTNRKIQLTTVVDGQTVDVFPNTKSEFVEFADGKTLEDKINKLGDAHGHSNATPDKDGFMSKEDKAKLDNVTNYTHPSTHAATMITEDATHRFVTDVEKTKWDNKADTTMASKTNAGLMSASDKQRIDSLNAEFKTRDDKITKNTEDIKSWNDEMINKEYQYFNGEDITIENSIISKTTDMVVKGSTLQNLIINGDQKGVINKSTNSNSRIHNRNIAYNLIPGKTYIGYINVTKYEGNIPNGLRIYGKVTGSASAIANKVGWNRFTWSIPTSVTSEIVGISIYIESNDFDNSGIVEFDSLMLFEYNSKIDNLTQYFEGIKSVGEEEDRISILSNGKNLVYKYMKGDFYQTSTNGIFVREGNKFCCVAKVKPNTKYFFSAKKDGINLAHGIYCEYLDKNKNYITFVNSNYNSYFSTPNNASYIRFRTHKDEGALENPFKSFEQFKKTIQLEEGTKATSYQPYQSDKKDILLQNLGFDEGLRGLNSTIYDELNSTKNVAIKRIEKIVIDGSTGNGNVYTYLSDKRFVINIPNLNINKKDRAYILCDKIPYNYSAYSNNSEYGISGYGDQTACFVGRWNFDKTVTDSRTFIEYLKSNPLIIYYELANQIESPLSEDINLQTFEERTYTSSDNIVKGDLSLIAPMNTAANLENNSNRLNTVEDYIDKNKNNIDKISKLEEGAVTSSLNIIDLQKEIKNENNYTHYEGSNINIKNLSKNSRTSNMIIKGQTYHNLIRNIKNNISHWIDNKDNYSLSLPSGSGQPSLLFNLSYQLKANQKYTVISEMTNYSSGYLHFSFMNENGNVLASTTEMVANSIGINKFVFTIKDNVEAKTLRLLPRNNIDNIYTINKKIIILEGDWTNKEIPSHFEGINSVGETELEGNQYKINILSSGENLFDGVLEIGSILSTGDNDNNTLTRVRSKNYIDIKKLSTVYISSTISGTLGIRFYDYNKKCLGSTTLLVGNVNSRLDLRENTYYIRFSHVDNTNLNSKYIISEKGINIDKFQPYQKNKKNIFIKEPLRGFNENICDIIYEDNDYIKINRKVKRKIFNGNEDWVLREDVSFQDILVFRLNSATRNEYKTDGILLSNNFDKYNNGYQNYEGIRLIGSENYGVTVGIYKTKLSTQDPAGFKKYLEKNNLILYCEATLPVVEIIENCVDLNLAVFKDQTYINSLNAIKGILSFNTSNSLMTQTKENNNNINKSLDSISSIINKTSKLESAQLSTALNVLELQKHTSMLDNGEINEYKDYNGYLINCNNTLDSRTENMIIRGRTLQNIVKLSECPYAIGKPAGNNNNINTKDLIIKLKPLTTYNIKVDLTIPKTLDTELVFALIKKSPWTNKMQKSTGIKNSGEYIFDITTGSDVSEINAYTFVMTIEEYQAKGVTINNIIFLENEKNIETVSYFEGIKSVGEEELNQDKYKINLLSYSNNLLIDSEKTINGEGDRDEFMKYGDLAPIFDKHGLKKYTISFDLKSKDISKNNIIQVYCQNGNGARYSISNNNIEVTTEFKRYSVVVNPILVDSSDKYSYLAFYGVYGTGNSPIVKNVKVEEGEIISPLFESYIEDKKQILLKEPLHEKNYIYQDNNKIKLYKKKSKYVFTGDENWNLNSADTFTDTMQFWLNTSSFMDKYSEITCNNFTFVSNRINENGIEGISKIGGNNLNVWITINKEKLTTKDVEGFKRWLKDNPTEIIYDLATPTVETLDLIDINLGTYKNKTYITTNNKIPSKLEFKTQNNFGAIMKNVNRCISKIFNSLNNILNIKGE